MGWVLILILAVLAVAFFYSVSVYNRFQTLRNGAEATLGQIKVALKKRLDMLTQLVDTVKSYAKFEKETLENITSLRSSVLKATSASQVSEIDRKSGQILGNILVTLENYPDLKTSQVVMELTSAIKNVEDEIARQRYTYNNIVQEYNTLADRFPSNMIANSFGFKKLDYLKFEEDINKTPNLKW